SASDPASPAVEAPHLFGRGLSIDPAVLWGLSVDLLTVEFFCARDDKVSPRCDMTTHEQFKDFFGLFHFFNIHPTKRPLSRIHGCFCQLIRVHFTKTFVSLHRLFNSATLSFYTL